MWRHRCLRRRHPHHHHRHHCCQRDVIDAGRRRHPHHPRRHHCRQRDVIDAGRRRHPHHHHRHHCRQRDVIDTCVYAILMTDALAAHESHRNLQRRNVMSEGGLQCQHIRNFWSPPTNMDVHFISTLLLLPHLGFHLKMVATFALSGRRSNHLDIGLIHTWLGVIHNLALSHPHLAIVVIHFGYSCHPQLGFVSSTLGYRSHPHLTRSHPQLD